MLIILFGRIGPFFRWLTVATACGWFGLFLFRGGNFQLAHLSLFVGFFLIGVALQLSQWKPSGTTAMRTLLVFFGVTLILAVCPQTQRGVWRAGLDIAPTPFAVSLWWIVTAGVVVPFLAWNVSQDFSTRSVPGQPRPSGRSFSLAPSRMVLPLQPSERSYLEAIYTPGDELSRGHSRWAHDPPISGSALGTPTRSLGGLPQENVQVLRKALFRERTNCGSQTVFR
jgi:hypothetical protein